MAIGSRTITMVAMTKPSLPSFLALVLYLSSHHALSFVTSPAELVGRSGRVGAVNSSSALNASFSASGASSAADTDDELSLLSSPRPSQRIQSRQQLRRDVLTSLFSMITTAIATTATLGSTAAYASLLEDYGADPNVNKQPEKTTKKAKELARDKGKVESSMEPNLRSNYYYPTNKVRYLPRIKKCSDAIPLVAISIGNEDWDAVRDFATVVADDTILPMKLYVSSLTGGGTNVKVGFAKDMMTAAKAFEKQQSLLVKSVDKKDVAKASSALEGMAEAMLSYRTSGKLLGPDGGGDIPSVDEIRRSTKRFRGEAFEAKVKERDARLKAAAAAEASN